jgi:hypothetical protein
VPQLGSVTAKHSSGCRAPRCPAGPLKPSTRAAATVVLRWCMQYARDRTLLCGVNAMHGTFSRGGYSCDAGLRQRETFEGRAHNLCAVSLPCECEAICRASPQGRFALRGLRSKLRAFGRRRNCPAGPAPRMPGPGAPEISIGQASACRLPGWRAPLSDTVGVQLIGMAAIRQKRHGLQVGRATSRAQSSAFVQSPCRRGWRYGLYAKARALVWRPHGADLRPDGHDGCVTAAES